MKAFILKQMRRGLFQPLWEALSHLSRDGAESLGLVGRHER